MALAFFDMDGTLVNGDTNDISIGHFVDLKLAPKSIIETLNEYERRFYLGTLDINEFVRFACTPLLGLDKDKLDEVLTTTIRDHIITKVRSGALDEIKFHQAKGNTIVIVTSTMDYLVQKVAYFLGIEHYIAAPMERVDGVLTGKQCGIVPYQKDKVTRIKEFVKEHNLSLEGSYGYGDTINDIPMLSLCTYKYAVNPNEKLLEHEFIKECKIVDWN